MAVAATGFRGGESFGRYRIIGAVGGGGMGVVYKALDPYMNRVVALKFVSPDRTPTKADQERLYDEARAAASLDHANIGVIFDIGEIDGQVFIVMAYYDGVALNRKIPALLTVQAVDIAAQIARGLAHAHAHNIIHRDIKPSNVIVCNDGTVKIIDFGIARVARTASETISSDQKGTAPYMSPEQILGTGADHRSDIWALGVVLAEMLTGKYPFRGDNIGARIYAITNEPPIGLDDLPVSLQAIVYRALAKRRTDRYQSCTEMLRDLEKVQALLAPHAGETVELVADSKIARDLERYKKGAAETPTQESWLKRQWRVLTAVLVLGLVLGIASPRIIDAIREWLWGPKEKHIAVLPFDIIGNDPEVAPLADGLMDSLTSKLSNLDPSQQSFWVVPATVVRKQHVDDPGSALRDLGATLVVKGSIQRSGSRVRLIVNLISTKPVRQIASADLDDTSGDYASLQDEAIERLSKVMSVAVVPGAAPKDGSNVPAAYESYLKAVGYMQRYDKPGNLDLAVAELTSATTKDPRFALGFAQLAEAYRLKFKVEKDPQWVTRSLDTCKKALAINDRIPTAWVTWGRIHTDTGKYEQAFTEFQKALDLNPRDADAIVGLARAYEQSGKLSEAEATFKKAAEMRPGYWDGYNQHALFYYRQHRYKQAIAPLRHALEITPDNNALLTNLAAMYLEGNDPNDYPDAERTLKHSIELGPTYGAYTNLGFLYMQQKRWADAAAISEKAAVLNQNDAQLWENMALAYEWMGNKEKSSAARDRQLTVTKREAETNPTDAVVQASLATLYAKRRDDQEALARIRTALRLAPTNSDVLVNAGQVYEYIGQRSSAIRYLQDALINGATLTDLQRDPALQGVLSDPKFNEKRTK